MKLTKTCTKFLLKHGGTIFAIGASIGVGLTMWETGKATVKATTFVTMNKDEPMTKKEIVKDCWKFYLPAAALGAGTIACILGSNALNKKQIASLTAGYMALGKAYQEYRQKVIENFGIEKEAEIHDQIKDFTSYLPGLDFTPEGDALGWCAEYLANEWEYYWIDFNYYKQTTDDGLEVYYVEAFQEPIKEFLDYDVMKRHLDYKGV